MSAVETPRDQKVVVKEMSWDPITRIVGSLGIHTEIDFSNRQVLKCYSTSMVFRGFDIFMKGIDPRDAHFITSRICGICGDNHCTCSCLNQNMAYSVKPPPLGDLAFNLAESADYMFDHAIFNDCMANVDFCEQMVKDTNPTLLATAEKPAEEDHGLVNAIEDSLTLVWCSGIAPPTTLFCLLEISHKPQGELGALLLCLTAADWHGGFSLLKQRSRSLRDGQEARGRSFHLD